MGDELLPETINCTVSWNVFIWPLSEPASEWMATCHFLCLIWSNGLYPFPLDFSASFVPTTLGLSRFAIDAVLSDVAAGDQSAAPPLTPPTRRSTPPARSFCINSTIWSSSQTPLQTSRHTRNMSVLAKIFDLSFCQYFLNILFSMRRCRKSS